MVDLITKKMHVESAWKKTLHQQEMLKVDELKCNPFAARIVELFSENGSGEINFQKFVNIFSVFSPRATQETKMVWAFAIWDFDGDQPHLCIATQDTRLSLSFCTAHHFHA